MLDKIETTMTGKEYLEYLRYKDVQKTRRKKVFQKWVKTNRAVVVTLILVLVIAITTITVIDIMQPDPVYTPIAWESIAKFLAFSVGIGWILHGVGFSIIGKLS